MNFLKKAVGILTKTLPWGKVAKNIKEMVSQKRWTELIMYVVFGGLFIYLIANDILDLPQLKEIVKLLQDLV